MNDVLQKIRNSSLKISRLLPNHYSSTLATNGHGMLKTRKFELVLTSNAHIDLFLAKRMRQEVSYICNRNSKANKKYLKFFDPKQESKTFCTWTSFI